MLRVWRRSAWCPAALRLAVLVACLWGCSSPPPAPPPSSSEATIEIQFDPSPGYSVSPNLYGGFVEFLGGVINGPAGLWAQEIADRGFDWPDDDGDGVSDGLAAAGRAAWVPVVSGRNTGDWILAPGGYNERGTYAQQVLVHSFEDGVRGVAQDGVPLRGGVSYRFHVYLKGENLGGQVTVALTDPHAGEELAAFSAGGVSADWRRFEAVLVPRLSTPAARFSVCLAGEGTLWIDEASLMASDSPGGVRAEYVELARQLGPGPLRYPGGCFADGQGNRFANGIGPIDQRPPNWDDAWGDWQRLDFGFDEYMAFCRLTGVEPQVTVNFGSASAAEAADWVEYANGDQATVFGALRAGHGHPEPYAVSLWEVGNEQYGEWEIGHTSPREYARRFVAYAAAMKQRDPSVKVMADGCLDPAWTRPLLEIAGPHMDYLTVHLTAPDLYQAPPDDDRVFGAMMAAPLVKEAHLRQLEAGIASLGLADRVRVGVSEWWVTYNYPPLGPARAQSLESALFTAGMLNVFQRSADFVDFANRTTFIAVLASALEPGPVLFGTPTFWALSLYASHSGPIPVRVSVSSPTYDAQAAGSIPPVPSVPILDVSATADGDRLYVMVLNRSADRTIATTLSFAGCEIEPTGWAHTLTSASYLDTNSEAPHDRVVPKAVILSGLGPSLAYTFPAHSLTCLELGFAP